MKREYSTSKEDSYIMGRELFLSKSKKMKWCMKYLKPISIFGATAYVLINPAESTINGEYHLFSSIVLVVVIQIPSCSVILYFILKAILNAPFRYIKKEIEKNPNSHWGKRTFSISELGLTLKSPDTELTVAPERVKDILETESMIVLTDDVNPIFVLPKSAFNINELQQALNQIKTDDADGSVISPENPTNHTDD